MIGSNTFRELFTENPMTLEATRTVRRMLRVGGTGENPYASRILYRFLFYTIAVLYFWLIASLLRTEEDMSPYLLISELGLLTLLVPGSLYGAIAVEREKQTYESLILTRLSPAQIVAGKLIWRVGLIAGLMALFAPPLLITHVMGAHHYSSQSLTWGELAWSQVVIFAWSVCVGAFALWVSAKSKKGITALLGVVASLIAFLALFPMLFFMFGGDRVYLNRDYPIRRNNAFNDDLYDSVGKNLPVDERQQIVVAGASAVVALNPVVMTVACIEEINSSMDEHSLRPMNYWYYHGIGYWGVSVYAGLTALFVRATTKTLRGLELPVAERTRRARLLTPKGKGA